MTAGLIDPVLALIVIMGIVALLPGAFALTRHWQLLSAPVFAGGFFAYFYVLLPAVGLWFRSDQYFFDERMYLFGILVAMLSLLAFYAGWVLKRPTRDSSEGGARRHYSGDLLYLFGAGFSIIGIIGYVTEVHLVGGWAYFYSKPHDLATRDVYMTAYIYDLWRFVFPGILLMLQAVLSASKRTWFRGKALFVCVLSALVLVQAVLRSSRQDSFFILAIWVLLIFFVRSKPPSRAFLAVTLFLIGFVPLLLLTFRPRLHLGAELSEFSEVQSSDPVEHFLRPGVGNEFITHSALVTACFDEGEYDYGQQVGNIIVNFVPRALWPEKPYDLFRVNPSDLITSHWGWVPAYGYVITGAGAVFFEWGFLGLFFWFLLGRGSRGLFEKARDGSARSTAIYVGLICVLFVFVAQDLWAGLKNVIFVFGPLCLSYALSRYGTLSPLEGKFSPFVRAQGEHANLTQSGLNVSAGRAR